MVPPDALLNLRFLGVLCVLLGGFTLVALYSPGGTLTGTWAAQSRALAGWAAAPWCAVLIAAGSALFYGRRALRRAVAGRLAGAALLLVALIGLHQLLTALPAPGLTPGDVLAAPPGEGGYAGLLFGAALAAWFGAPGAALLLLPVAVLGFGLLCGWSVAAWRRLARRSGVALGRAGRGAWGVACAFWTGLTWSGRQLSRAAAVTGRLAGAGAAAGAQAVAGRFRSWGNALVAVRLAPPPALPLPAESGALLTAPRPRPRPRRPPGAARARTRRRRKRASCWAPRAPPPPPSPGPAPRRARTCSGSCPRPPSSNPPPPSRSARRRWRRRPA